MKHITFGTGANTTFKTAILIKEKALNKQAMDTAYIKYLTDRGLSADDFVGLSLDYNSSNKAPMRTITACLDNLLKAARQMGVKTLLVCDAAYFKKLTKRRTAESSTGYVLPCTYPGYEGMKVVYCVNYESIHHNPDNGEKILHGLQTLKNHMNGKVVKLGSDIIHHEEYPSNVLEIKKFLEKLMQYPKLYADIETFSLKVDKAKLGTIGFAWSKHAGGAFAIDAEALPVPKDKQYLQYKQNRTVRRLLREFLIAYEGIIVWHNGSFDMKILIAELFMDTLIDYAGMNEGIKVLTRDFEDTKVIAYLALNSCGTNSKRYSLKNLAHEFAGDYAESDINDIRKIRLPKLLRYNLVDCLSTAFVEEKYYPRMVKDMQLMPYEAMFKPSIKLLLKAELVGMPISMERVDEVDAQLGAESFKHEQYLRLSHTIQTFESEYREALAAEYNRTHKVARRTAEDFMSYKINLNSGDQVGDLLHYSIGLPILETTDTGKPSTSASAIEKLMNHTASDDVKKVLESILGITKIEKIRNTFIKAFRENSILKPDGNWYLHGNFNVTGTVSGRLSSNSPNLQNLPSGSKYGKLIKSCFQSNDRWIFCGADYASLEDRVDTLLTKDPNKLKIYAGTRQYDVTLNGETHRITEDTIVSYDGKEMKGDELYELLTNR